MNRITKIAATTLLVACASFAQEGPKFGVHAGLGLTGFNGSDAKEVDGGLGFAVGGAMVMPMGGALSIAPELLFSYRTASNSSEFMGVTVDRSSTEMAIDLPIFVRYTVAPSIFVQGGPQLGYVLSAKTTVEAGGEEKTDDNENRAALEYGLTVGAGYQINEQIAVDVRYNYGLSKADDEGDANATPYQIMLGGTFLF